MIRMTRDIGYQFIMHDNPSQAAAIAFYSLFALAPTLVFGVALANWIFGPGESQDALEATLAEIFTADQAQTLMAIVEGPPLTSGNALVTTAAILLLLYGASAAFVQLRLALNTIFGLTAETLHEQVHTTLMGRLLAAAFVILVGLLEIAFIAANETLQWVATKFDNVEKVAWLSVEALQWLNRGLSWLIVGLLFAGLLKFLPMRSPAWKHVIPGAIVSLILFELGKIVLGFYLTRAVIATAYGASSSLVAIMIWMYYSVQTLLLGAEITRYRAERETHHAGEFANPT